MFNIILFISTYPVLLIIYFVLKNNHKFHDHLLFSVSMKEEWVEQPAVQKIISEFHKQMNILLLIFFAIPLTSLLTSHFSIQFTIWMNWLMLLILLFYVPYAIANKKLKKWKKENQLYENQILVSYVKVDEKCRKCQKEYDFCHSSFRLSSVFSFLSFPLYLRLSLKKQILTVRLWFLALRLSVYCTGSLPFGWIVDRWKSSAMTVTPTSITPDPRKMCGKITG